MIKKARDIQLGDKILGRTIRVIRKGDQDASWAKRVRIYFLDRSDSYASSMDLKDDWDVLLDDPEPCCKPAQFVITKFASDLRAGDTVCVPISCIESGYCVVRIYSNRPEALVFGLDEHVRVLEEVPIES